MAVFWVVAITIALMMEAARTSETLVNLYQTTWRYNPEDSHLQDSSNLLPNMDQPNTCSSLPLVHFLLRIYEISEL
jgi:hypothetical protein